MGLFTQEDPIGIAGGLNLYGYANGDPVNFSDPFGLFACPPLCDSPDPENDNFIRAESGEEVAVMAAAAVVAATGGLALGAAAMAAGGTAAVAGPAALAPPSGAAGALTSGAPAGLLTAGEVSSGTGVATATATSVSTRVGGRLLSFAASPTVQAAKGFWEGLTFSPDGGLSRPTSQAQAFGQALGITFRVVSQFFGG